MASYSVCGDRGDRPERSDDLFDSDELRAEWRGDFGDFGGVLDAEE